jgi:hypothetical protein
VGETGKGNRNRERSSPVFRGAGGHYLPNDYWKRQFAPADHFHGYGRRTRAHKYKLSIPRIIYTVTLILGSAFTVGIGIGAILWHCFD